MHHLNKKDLDEDVVITLVAKNPQAPHNKIRFDHTTGTYISQKLVESMIDHLEIESTCIHKDSEEGKKQLKATEDTEDVTDGKEHSYHRSCRVFLFFVPLSMQFKFYFVWFRVQESFEATCSKREKGKIDINDSQIR